MHDALLGIYYDFTLFILIAVSIFALIQNPMASVFGIVDALLRVFFTIFNCFCK
ncbi:hypothetical protein AB4K20DRAFT_1878476 [Rhizopus microsporus]